MAPKTFAEWKRPWHSSRRSHKEGKHISDCLGLSMGERCPKGFHEGGFYGDGSVLYPDCATGHMNLCVC